MVGLDEGAWPDAPLLMLEDEDWENVFEVYKGHRILALNLATNFIDIKQAIERGKKREAIETLNQAINLFFPHTDFGKASRKLYWQKLEDKITPKQKKRLRKLGMKI